MLSVRPAHAGFFMPVCVVVLCRAVLGPDRIRLAYRNRPFGGGSFFPLSNQELEMEMKERWEAFKTAAKPYGPIAILVVLVFVVIALTLGIQRL
jgi:hypothetical protein